MVITVWMLGDSLVHWLGKHVKATYSAPPVHQRNQVKFEFYGQRGAKLANMVVNLRNLIREKGDLPHFILLHVGTNDIANVHVSTKEVVRDVERMIHQVVGELFDSGVYSTGAHRFQGIIWSNIVPRYKWMAFNNQKAAEDRCKRVNAAAAAVITRASFWVLKHDNFKAHMKLNYRIPDPTHLSDLGNRCFYRQLEMYMSNIVESQWLTITASRKYAF